MPKDRRQQEQATNNVNADLTSFQVTDIGLISLEDNTQLDQVSGSVSRDVDTMIQLQRRDIFKIEIASFKDNIINNTMRSKSTNMTKSKAVGNETKVSGAGKNSDQDQLRPFEFKQAVAPVLPPGYNKFDYKTKKELQMQKLEVRIQEERERKALRRKLRILRSQNQN